MEKDEEEIQRWVSFKPQIITMDCIVFSYVVDLIGDILSLTSNEIVQDYF